MLDVQLTKRRGHFTVAIRFACPDGQLFALTGPSGSGKTTIIRALAGLEQPDSGCIRYNETTWYDSRMRVNLKARMRKVGYVFQEHTLFPHLSIRKNVAFACGDDWRVTDLLDMFRIRHLEKRRPQQVSGGERQRAALAQALASGPDVLLLDEPFSALDAVTRDRLRKELCNLKDRFAIPIIMVTHDLEEARLLADRQICLEQGAVVACEENRSGRRIGGLSALTA